mgnify:FL=1
MEIHSDRSFMGKTNPFTVLFHCDNNHLWVSNCRRMIGWADEMHILNVIFSCSALAGGKFRMVLLLVVMFASSLFLDDVRVKVWHLMQQGKNIAWLELRSDHVECASESRYYIVLSLL